MRPGGALGRCFRSDQRPLRRVASADRRILAHSASVGSLEKGIYSPAPIYAPKALLSAGESARVSPDVTRGPSRTKPDVHAVGRTPRFPFIEAPGAAGTDIIVAAPAADAGA